MNEALKTIIATLDRDGIAPLKGIQLTEFEGAFLDRALSVEPGQSLFHYMRLNRFKDLLASGAIYMRRLDLFQEDPHEGKFPAANSHTLSSLAKGLGGQLDLGGKPLAALRHFYEGKMRELTYVHCWFGWDVEDARMWKEYGDGGSGVCIRTTVRRLGEALISAEPDFTINICGVNYVDDEAVIPEEISFMAICRKRPQYAHEREFRLIGELGMEGWQKYGDSTPDHQLVKVNFERLFERVYTGPNASAETCEEIKRLGNKAAGCNVVYPSAISNLGAA